MKRKRKPDLLEILSNGPEILSSTFWGSDMEQDGYFYLSINAGTLRLLCPKSRESMIPDMDTAEHVLATWGRCVDPTIMEGLRYGKQMVELLFEDHSETPFLLFISRDEQTDRVPLTTDIRELVMTVWRSGDGAPELVMTKPCYCRVGDIPCMQPLTN